MAPSAEEPPDDEQQKLREMEAYMMADLGRGRQEELPLNERSRSVYNPDRRRGQVKVSKALKGRLATGWGNPIQDEEATQMEGLVVEDAPWRRGTERPAVQSITKAKPRPIPTTRSIPLRDNTVSLPAPVPKTASTPPAPKAASTPPVPKAARTPSLEVAPPELTFSGALEQARTMCSLEFTSIPDTFETVAVYWGVLLVRPGPENFFSAEWEIVMQGKPPSPVSASLILRSTGLPDRVHDICLLNAPYMNEDKGCCVIATSGPVAEHSYYVQLQDNSTKQEFADSLYGLQKLVHDIKAKEPTKSPPRLGPETVETPAATTKLVELDQSERATMDFEAILTAISGLDQITDALAEIDFNPELFKTLDSITGNWFLKRYPDMNANSRLSMTTSVLDMLKRHIGIKQSEMVCEPGPKPSEIPESIKDLARPITYTPDEIEALRGKGCLPDPDAECNDMTPEESKIVWRRQPSKGLGASRWSSED